MPGEIEERTKARRTRDGIEIDDKTWSQIRDTASAVGLADGQIKSLLGAV